MADSGALRQRRSKAHKQGDHRLCRSSCPGSGRFGAFSVSGEPAASADDQDGQEIPAGDTGKMRWLAGQLALAYRADPGNALLARELRMTLQALAPRPGGQPADGELEDLFAELGAS